MAVTWGAGSGPIAFYVGIDISTSGTTVTVRYYVKTDANSVSDSQTLTLYGAAGGTVNFAMTTPNGGAQLVATRQFTAARGTSFSVGASLSGVYNGATPSHTRSGSVPALAPSMLSITGISSITSSSAAVTLSAASANGSAVAEYQVQASTSSSFSSELSAPRGSSRTQTVTNLPANSTVYVRGRARNGIGWSGWSGVKTLKTLPSAPPPPGAPTITRISDSQHTLAWTRNATTAAPYTSQQVQRATNDGGAWVTIATLTGTATSYSDTTTAANAAYWWRIVASNSAGIARGGESAVIQTTPAAAVSASASKTATANILITWDRGATIADVTWQVQHSADGGATWGALTTVAGSTTSFTHISPSAATTHTYRVRAASTVGATTYSAWTTTGIVQLAAPPAAPTLISPVEASDADRLGAFTWRHNSIDSSPQSAYSLRYRAAGTSTWTTIPKTASTVSAWTPPEGVFTNGQAFEWQVQTWGQHATAGPWSSAAIPTFTATPIVTITDPVDEVTVPTLTAEWAFYQESGSSQVAYVADLIRGGEIVESLAGGTDTRAAFATVLPDGSTWTVRIRAQSAAGLWSDEVDQTFTVDYLEPSRPIVSPVWQQEDGTIEVGIENPPATTYSWEGVENGSPSIKEENGVEAARNYHRNPGAVSTEGFGFYSGGSGNAVSMSLVNAGWSLSERAASVTWTDVGSSEGDIHAVVGPIAGVGTVVTVVFRWVASRSGMVMGAPRVYDGNVGHITTTARSRSANLTAMAGEVVEDWATFAIPQGATADLRLYVAVIAKQPGDSVDMSMADAYIGEYQPDREWFSGSSESTVEALTNDVYRRIGEGEWIRIATAVPTSGVIVDRLPTVAGVNQYKVVAFSDLPSSASSEVAVVEVYEPGWCYLNWGHGFGRVCRLYGNVKLAGKTAREKSLHSYAG